MRNKTLNQIAQEAAKYVVETLEIERALVLKLRREEERASVEMRTGIGDDIVDVSREYALLIAIDWLKSESNLVANIEQKLYKMDQNES